MRKLLFLLVLFGISQTLFAQKGEKRISLNFENSKRIDVVKQIENLTDYHFYFIESWLDDTLISGAYTHELVRNVLDDIFKGTDVNYYIFSKSQIILTKNSFIRSQLPSNFIEEDSGVDTNNNVVPIFAADAQETDNQIETIRIGKESAKAYEETYAISGYVRNKKTKEPLTNLVLLVRGKSINAVTNIDGFYTINLPPGPNIIEFKSLVVNDVVKRLLVYNDGKANFDLDVSSEIMLEGVTITAQEDKNVAEVIAGITKIEMEGVKTIPLVLGERDLLKVATALPGISTAGEGASGYNVRGGKTDQNLILIDEAIVYSPTHFFGIFSALNPYTVGSLEIYKGNIPVEYGGRLSSVFDIKTKKSNTEKFSGEAAIGPVTSNLMLEIPVVKEKSSLLLGGRGTYSDWVLQSLDDESLKNSQASFYDFILKYQHKINDNNNVEATGYYSNDKFSITSDSLYSYSNQLATLKWNHVFSEKSKGSLTLNNSQYQFNIGFSLLVCVNFIALSTIKKINKGKNKTLFQLIFQRIKKEIKSNKQFVLSFYNFCILNKTIFTVRYFSILCETK